MTLQHGMQSIHIVEPLPGPAMNDFRQVTESRLAQIQQLLAFQIALPSLPRNRCHQGDTMRG